MRNGSWLVVVLGLALTMAFAGPVRADPAHVPGGPCIEARQEVQLSSVPSPDAVARMLDSIAAASGGGVEVHTAGLSGEGRPLLYATVGHRPGRLLDPGADPRQRDADHRGGPSGPEAPGHQWDPEASRILDRLTLVVVPMYNPDGAASNVRLSTNPLQIDLNRDWVLFRQPESRGFYRSGRRRVHDSRSIFTSSAPDTGRE